MAAHASAGAAAAFAAGRSSSASTAAFMQSRLRSELYGSPTDARAFEAEMMKLLTRTALKRFAASGTVPPADTKESLLEACNSAVDALRDGGDEGDDNSGGGEASSRRFDAPLAVDDTLLTAEGLRRLRLQQHRRWLLAVPSRLRSFLEQNKNNETKQLDCFRDMIVRLPVLGAGKHEVVAFCSQFGECVYQGPCAAAAEAEAQGGKTQEKDNHNPRRFCHIVTFADGADAIKCFVELNGFFIDPQACQQTLEGIVAAAVKQSAAAALNKKQAPAPGTEQNRDQNSEEEEARRATAKIVEQIPTVLSDLHVRSGEEFLQPQKQPKREAGSGAASTGAGDDDDEDETREELLRCWSSRLIFVTCDFFRAGLHKMAELAAAPERSEFVPRAELMTRPVAAAGAGSASWSPVDIVCRKLALRAQELVRVLPLVNSHRPDVEWVGFARAANCVAMFVTPPVYAAPASALGTERTAHERVRLWFLTLRALRQCKINIVALFRAIDAAVCAEDLLESSRLFALRSTPLQPPSPSRSRSAAADCDSPSKAGGTQPSLTDVAVLPSIQQMLSGFVSPDPARRGSNAVFEMGAIALGVVVAIWALVVGYVMIVHPKPRHPVSVAVENNADL